MLSESSIKKISYIIDNNRQPKKRISKACIKCKNSKNRCVNIEKGVCERCVELNEICIYDYSLNNFEDNSKALISKEYLVLLQNKSMLLELVLKNLFNDFDKLVNNDIIKVNENKYVDASLAKQRDLWALLVRENSQFCNPKEVNTNFNHLTTKHKSNFEINPLVQMVLPEEAQSAMEAINFVGKGSINDLFGVETQHKVNEKTSVEMNYLSSRKRRRSSSTTTEGTKSKNGTPNELMGFELVNDFYYTQSDDNQSIQSDETLKKQSICSMDESCKVKMDLKMILND